MDFQVFETSKLSKASTFVKRCVWLVCHQTGSWQIEQSLSFFKFLKFEVSTLWKPPTFVKRDVWVVFHQAGGLQNEQSLFFQAFEDPEFWKAPTFVKKCGGGQFSPRFCKRFSILEENYGADIIKEHLHVRLLLTSTAKTVVE